MKPLFAHAAGHAFGLALIVTVTGLCNLSAAEPPAPAASTPPPAEKKGWETSAAAGATLTRGNSDTLMLTLSLNTARKWDKSEASFGLSAGYGEDNGDRNTEFLRGFGDYRYLVTDRFYTGLNVEGTYDGIARLDYRVVISPMAGYYLIKNTKTRLSVEGGPALVLERYADQEQDGYWAARLGEKFEHQLSKSTKIWQSLSYVARLDKWSEKYIITGEAGIDTAITEKWSLRTVFQNIYDSQPAPDRKHNDMRLIAGTAYKF